MPCYNAQATVGRAIESIQQQSLSTWELIVVDDGSTDQSAERIDTIAKTDHRIRLLQQEHQGVVAASNAGFALAQAPLIARMDADDVSLPDRLVKQSLYLEQHPDVDAVSCLARFAGNLEIWKRLPATHIMLSGRIN